MRAFMLLIRNEIESKSDFSAEQHREFVDKCRIYIEGLQREGKMITAQPLVRYGKMISNPNGSWQEGPFAESGEAIVGYYHILARDMEEAVAIAKDNPEFAFTPNARVEVRPIKMREESISYDYPTGNK